MQLTRYTDYALRTLIALGLNSGGKLTVADIATAYGISRNHLVKVAARLAESGYVKTLRGKGGGMRLARPPGEIRIGAVVRDMEAELGVVECLAEGGGHCVISQVCRLRSLLHDATGAFLDSLDRYTLEDLLRQPQPVARLLHIPIRSERRA
jgi:Rrf2 family transcriptional regulator, nitric oxide-sensitive transcriptional repressor